MYEELKGKKLLIMGATSGEVPIVERAKKFGIYTIATDYHTDYSYSPAKLVADEAWDVSWSDVDTLEKLCRENSVDGVTAGFSEFRVENTIKLCERLGLPCYATMEQLDITRDKIKFKNVCRANGVPVVREYVSVEDVQKYPVIVKPTDRAGTIGVTVAENHEELIAAYDYAMEMSVCKSVIIEDFICDATEVDAYYMIMDGKITLMTTDDIVKPESQDDGKVIQSVWLCPMQQEKAFLETEDENLRCMIRNMGIQNGCIFFSGFVNEAKEFVWFECGFRMWGEHEYEYVARRGMCNYLDIFIVHALTGSTDLVVMEEGNPKLKSAAINFYSRAGVLNEITGMDEIRRMEDCYLSIVSGRIGSEYSDDRAILTKLALVGFCHESEARLRDDLAQAYRLFGAYDTMGRDMVYDRINPELLMTWWKDR